jgi:hypothetical protein
VKQLVASELYLLSMLLKPCFRIEGIPDDIKALYKTSWELSQKCIIDMAADRGKLGLRGYQLKNNLEQFQFYLTYNTQMTLKTLFSRKIVGSRWSRQILVLRIAKIYLYTIKSLYFIT